MFMFNYLLIMISMLVSVAFYTILERKILGCIQIWKGPNKVGILGILQPFSDAIKLFNKSLSLSESTNFLLAYSTPALTLLIALMMLPLLMFKTHTLFDIKHTILMFFILSTFSVYFIMLIGWSTNSKYCYMGAIRSVAQMISYEVSFFLIILFMVILSKSYSLTQISESQMMLYFLTGNLILLFMWLISCLAETNRSPFDFAEGESELVSGFNVEYMGGWFALIFLAEYMSMLILSIMTTLLFMGSMNYMIPLFMTINFAIFFIWVRGTYPRFRYDTLMNLSWKIFLPTSLFFICLSMMMSFYFY